MHAHRQPLSEVLAEVDLVESCRHDRLGAIPADLLPARYGCLHGGTELIGEVPFSLDSVESCVDLVRRLPRESHAAACEGSGHAADDNPDEHERDNTEGVEERGRHAGQIRRARIRLAARWHA